MAHGSVFGSGPRGKGSRGSQGGCAEAEDRVSDTRLFKKRPSVSSGAAAWLCGGWKGGPGPTLGSGLSRKALGCSSGHILLEGLEA